MAIQIKTLDELKTMRRAGLLVGQTLDLMRESIKVGMRTDALDAIAAANIKRGGATSNFKGYHGFPATICISLNDEIVHGIPGDRIIEDGDVVSIDCGAIIDGWHGDAAFVNELNSIFYNPHKFRKAFLIYILINSLTEILFIQNIYFSPSQPTNICEFRLIFLKATF
jgi:hypothetical protein